MAGDKYGHATILSFPEGVNVSRDLPALVQFAERRLH